MTRIGNGVVYGDDQGRVVYAADDGSREVLGHKDPEVPVAATDETGWAAWVETGEGQTKVMVKEAATGNDGGVGGGGRRCARWLRWTVTPSTTSTSRARTRCSRAAARRSAGHPARPSRRPLADPGLPDRPGHDRGRPVLFQRRFQLPGLGRRALPGRQHRGHPAAGHRAGRGLRHPLRRGSFRTAYPTATTWSPSRRARGHRDLRRRARRPVARARARAPHLRARPATPSAPSPPGSPTRAAPRCWHAERMGDAPVPPGRRLRLRPAHRQPGRGRPRRRRPRRRPDAAVRAVDQPVRDDVPAATHQRRRPTTGCGSSPPGASCRSPATRRSAARTPGSRRAVRRAAGPSCRSAAPGWSPSRGGTGWRSRRRRCCATARSATRTSTTITQALRISRDDIVDSKWFDNGPGWVGVLLADAQAVLDLRPDPTAFDGLGHRGGRSLDRRRLRRRRRGARVRPRTVEDPVTGSLNASLGQWLAGGRLPERVRRRPGHRDRPAPAGCT